MAFYRRIDGAGAADGGPPLAVMLAVTCPLYWFTAARPLSDTTGLVLALALQAMALGAANRTLPAVGFLAGLCAGFRSQVVWLTIPLLVYALVRQRGAGTVRTAVLSAIAFAAGALLWFVPLVVLTGGPSAYWRVLAGQGAEDLSGIQMLWTTPTPRELASTLYYAFVAPWARWEMAVIMLTLALVGLGGLWREPRDRRSPGLALAIAFVPYFVFDLLFQETFTTRYALPLVVPVAYLAARGVAAAGSRIGVVVAVVLAMVNGHTAGTTVAAYARQKAPVFRLLDDMVAAETSLSDLPVLATDRREDLDLRRPTLWLGGAGPRFSERLPAPPQHEWLEPVKYWNRGGRGPLWLVADPRRAQVDLIAHDAPRTYRWGLPYPVLLGGVRPNEMDWYRIDRPDWYVGAGWALTPEAAGVAELDHRGPATGPIDAWVHESVLGGTLVIGGRNFDAATATRLHVELDGRGLTDIDARPAAPFLGILRLPPADASRRGYRRLTVAALPPVRAAIEQFDASSRRPVFGFGDGWQEQEYNPALGLRWRWLSERGELRVSAGGPVVLHLEGESPRKYFSRGSRLVVRSGGGVVFDGVLTTDFSLDIPIAAPVDPVTLDTDQVDIPAERSRRTRDRRHLGLRIFKCELRRR